MQLELPFLRLQEPAMVSGCEPLVSEEGRPDRVDFVRMRTAKRYVLRVRADGTLRVTVPRGGSRREAQEFVERNRRWIERERRRVREEHGSPQWMAGRRILLRGEAVTLDVQPHPDGYDVRYGSRRVIVRALDAVRTAVEADMRQLAQHELLPRLHMLAARHGLTVGRVTIRNQRSRWGSCGRRGNIALNFRLVQMPPEVRDYVLLHELMHLRQQNHSRRFWRLVESACPDFRDAERWLRTAGRSLF